MLIEPGASVVFWLYLEATSTVEISSFNKSSRRNRGSDISVDLSGGVFVSAPRLLFAASIRIRSKAAHGCGGLFRFNPVRKWSVRRLDVRRIRFAHCRAWPISLVLARLNAASSGIDKVLVRTHGDISVWTLSSIELGKSIKSLRVGIDCILKG